MGIRAIHAHSLLVSARILRMVQGYFSIRPSRSLTRAVLVGTIAHI